MFPNLQCLSWTISDGPQTFLAEIVHCFTAYNRFVKMYCVVSRHVLSVFLHFLLLAALIYPRALNHCTTLPKRTTLLGSPGAFLIGTFFALLITTSRHREPKTWQRRWKVSQQRSDWPSIRIFRRTGGRAKGAGGLASTHAVVSCSDGSAI